MAVAAPTVGLRPKVTVAFLSRPGGYLTDDMRLLRVLAAPKPNDKHILVEDCWKPIYACAVDEDRMDVMRMRVVRWPEGLD